MATSPVNDPEPRIAAYNSARRRDARVPFFAVDVDRLRPGQAAVVDATSIGFPYLNLRNLPAGDYYVQAVMNVYTQFHRADGHVIWAHMDQWKGSDGPSRPETYSAGPRGCISIRSRTRL